MKVIIDYIFYRSGKTFKNVQVLGKGEAFEP